MDLDPVEIRVLGCLLEKQRTTPDVYPLSLNALRLACNQSTNRDPVVSYDEASVREALTRLGRRRYTRLTSGHGSRAAKFRHLLDEALGIKPDEQAVLAVLMLRGPQTPGELRARTERLHAFVSAEELQATLDRLAERELVVRLPRRPGQKEERYAQLLGEEAEEAPAPAAQPVAAAPPPASAQPVAATPAPASAQPVAAAPAPAPAPPRDERLDRLERELAELRAEVEALRAALGG